MAYEIFFPLMYSSAHSCTSSMRTHTSATLVNRQTHACSPPTHLQNACLLSRVPEEGPEAVVQLMDDCLEEDPLCRPSAKEIIGRLEALL